MFFRTQSIVFLFLNEFHSESLSKPDTDLHSLVRGNTIEEQFCQNIRAGLNWICICQLPIDFTTLLSTLLLMLWNYFKNIYLLLFICRLFV